MAVTSARLRRTERAPGRLQTVVVIAVTMVLIGGLSWVVTDGFDDGVTGISVDGNLAVDPPTVGQPPAAFAGPGYDGTPISLADFAGRPLWLNFGASWCQDCRTEAADLEAVYQAHEDQGLAVLGVFINDPPGDIAAYVGRAGLTFPIVADQSTRIAGTYRIVGIPTHIFIGRDGRIREIRIGALSRAEMEKSVEALLR